MIVFFCNWLPNWLHCICHLCLVTKGQIKLSRSKTNDVVFYSLAPAACGAIVVLTDGTLHILVLIVYSDLWCQIYAVDYYQWENKRIGLCPSKTIRMPPIETLYPPAHTIIIAEKKKDKKIKIEWLLTAFIWYRVRIWCDGVLIKLVYTEQVFNY